MNELLHAAYVPWIVLALLVAGFLTAFWLLLQTNAGGTKLQPKKLLTENEIEFLFRLRRALPGFEVMPQVSMGALVAPRAAEGSQAFWACRRLFAMKVVDYVVCAGPQLQVVAVVELDDKTHDAKRGADARRDAMLLSAGIRTIRWDSRAKPSQSQIAAAFHQ